MQARHLNGLAAVPVTVRCAMSTPRIQNTDARANDRCVHVILVLDSGLASGRRMRNIPVQLDERMVQVHHADAGIQCTMLHPLHLPATLQSLPETAAGSR